MRHALNISILAAIALAAVSCGKHGQAAVPLGDSTAIVRSLYGEALRLGQEHNEDSALALMLNAADYQQGCHDLPVRYNLLHDISSAYERKNLFDLQEKYLRLQLEVSFAMDDKARIAHNLFGIGVSRYAQGDDADALSYLDKAYANAPADSAMLKARCQVMRGQIFIQTGDNDSLSSAIEQACADCPSIVKDESYHLAEAYWLSRSGRQQEAESKITQYVATDGIYAQTELLTLLMEINEKQGKTGKARTWQSACWS